MEAKIDLSKAPEMATHYAIVDGDVVYFKSHGENVNAFYDGIWIQECGHKSWIMDNIKQIPEKTSMIGVSIPVYTAAMCDAGELPSAMIDVQIRRDYGDDNEFYNGHLVHECNGILWFVDDKYGGCLHSSNEVTIKPLTPPIKLEDGKAYQFDYKDETGLVGICNATFKFNTKHVMLEMPKANASYNSEYCTNIKLLEVK